MSASTYLSVIYLLQIFRLFLQVSMAVRKAVRSDTIHEMRDGVYMPVTRSFLDSRLLEDELLEAQDALTRGMMNLPAHSGSEFFTDQYYRDNREEVRVLPVYVFSLAGMKEVCRVDLDIIIILSPFSFFIPS